MKGILGKEHTMRWGSQPGVLIKLIDSKERLTVQVHPDKETAEKLFHSPFGKTESWHILDTRPEEENPCIYLGFREGITRDLWEECFCRQDYEKMLSLMNQIQVKKGETYLVKGGVPHAIGAGCLLIEVQEPTEFYCLYVLEGKGTLESPSQTWEIAAGAQFFVPAACGEYCIRAAQGETVRVLKMHGPK